MGKLETERWYIFNSFPSISSSDPSFPFSPFLYHKAYFFIQEKLGEELEEEDPIGRNGKPNTSAL